MAIVNDQNNQETSFLAAYDEYADAIFRYCFYKTSNRELAKDLVQQTFFKTWSYLKEGNTVDEFRSFLYRTANNLIIDWYRRSKSDSLDKMMEAGYEPSSQQAGPAEQTEVSWALAMLKRLDDEDQQLITWRFVEDISVKEIAKMLDDKENNVSVRIHRAMDRLKKLLQTNNDHGTQT